MSSSSVLVVQCCLYILSIRLKFSCSVNVRPVEHSSGSAVLRHPRATDSNWWLVFWLKSKTRNRSKVQSRFVVTGIHNEMALCSLGVFASSGGEAFTGRKPQ